MDVNGTRFHLLLGEPDWARCGELPQDGGPARPGDAWQDAARDVSGVTLRARLSLFRPRSSAAAPPLTPETRRGAARDRFGNVYWIGRDERTIWWQPSGSPARKPALWWSQEPAACPPEDGGFTPRTPGRPPARLAGLAVTEHHYLVVGDAGAGGLFLFDLHAGGEPMRLPFPGGPSFFTPFDIAAAPDAGVWVLDRVHRAYWGVDRHFRVFGALPPPVATGASAAAFAPRGEEPADSVPDAFPAGFALDAADPVSIEGLPDGTVVVLDSPGLAATGGDGSPPASALVRYRLGARLNGPLLLEISDTEVVVEGTGETLPPPFLLVGYDLAYDEEEGEPRLLVVERDGNQVVALRPDWEASPDRLDTVADFLPLYYFGGRAIFASGGRTWYDVDPGGATGTDDSRVRWTPLERIDQPRYERSATLVTPPLDGREDGCVWHRLFLDGCLPAESSVTVYTRTQDDRDLLEATPWSLEPRPYRRAAGAEVPYYDPFPRRETPDGEVGVWETLFQGARGGRWLQIRLDLAGNGRVTPRLQSLRAYYPRFSYPRRYLPKVYQDDPVSAHFLERFLANSEGFHTEIEGRIRDISLLFDARSAPPEALDWLGGWVGLLLDPLWGRLQEERAKRGVIVSDGPRRPPWVRPRDRRRLFIRFAPALFERRGTPGGVRLALLLLLDPCLEDMLDGLKAAAVNPSSPWHDRLRELGLLSPTPAAMDDAVEDILLAYLLSPCRPSKVRLVERFLTRGGRAGVAGDPTAGEEADGGEGVADPLAAAAHRFSVLVPNDLSAEEEAMTVRVVEMEKPAHAAFDVRRYWDYFRVGEVRVGIDTILGESSRFTPMLLGRAYLSEGYLAAAPPMDATDRVILNRDRLGDLPPL